MSTRGHVGIKNEDGTVSFKYNHYDSYFDGVGEILQNHFNSEEKAKKLIADGDAIYTICKNEELEKASSEEEYLKIMNEDVFIEFSYLWKDGQWYGAASSMFNDKFNKFQPLKEILEKLEELKDAEEYLEI